MRYLEPDRAFPEIMTNEYDSNDKFVLTQTIKYLINHFSKFSTFNDEAFETICWTLGASVSLLENFLIENIDEKFRPKLISEIEEHSKFSEEYASVLLKILKKTPKNHISAFRQRLINLLSLKFTELQYENDSQLESNIKHLKTLFQLSENEIGLITFFFIIEVYEKPEQFFDNNLKCKKFPGRKYLCNILNINESTLSSILNGSLKELEIFEFYKSDIDFDREFLGWFQNPSDDILTEKLYTKLKPGSLSVKDFFIDKKQINHVLKILKKKSNTSTHLLFYGPPGAGKTSFARSIATKLGVQTYEILGSNDNKSINRQTAVKACLNMTNKGDGSLIVIDEADNLLNTQMSWFMRGETQDKGSLNKLLDEPGSRIIWITNTIDSIEDSVLRRFAYSVHFPSFNLNQRVKLWQSILSKNKCDKLLNKNEIKSISSRFNVSAGAISIAVQKSAENWRKNKNKFLEAIEMILSSHQTLMNGGKTYRKKESTDKNYSLKGLNLNTDIHTLFKQLKIFDRYLKGSLSNDICNMNLLFFGAPGTGKSEFARYISDRLDRKMICKKVSDIQSKWVGESEKNIRNAFYEAEQDNAILIIDEADSLLFNRAKARNSWEISFTNEFLTQMERFRGILICTTNRASELDKASIRRFNHKIEFKYLDSQGNLIFYKKMIAPLLKTRLNKNHKKMLMAIKQLAPGDFKTVRNNYAFYSSDELAHKDMIAALLNEAKYKAPKKRHRKIGF